MKTSQILAILLTILLAIPCATAQTVETISSDALFKELKKVENAQYTNISPIMMTMARAMVGGEEKAFLEKIKSMRIISFIDCSTSDMQRVAERLRTIELKGYEPGATTTENDTEMRVFIKTKDDKVKEIVIATITNSAITLMQINGDVTLEDLEKLSKNNPANQQQ